MLAEKSIRIKYKAVLNAPNSDPMVYEGTSLWVSPGIVYVHYKASGGDEKMIVRVGREVWLYHEFANDWITAEEAADKGAGSGVQNVEAVLLVLRGFEGKVESEDGGTCLVSEVRGEELQKMMKEHSIDETFSWDNSSASATVNLSKENGLIEKCSFAAELVKEKDDKGGIAGTLKYEAEVTVEEYGGPEEYRFEMKDERGQPVRLKLSSEIERAKKALREKAASREENVQK